MMTNLKPTIPMSTQQMGTSSRVRTVAGLQHDDFGVVLTLFACYQHSLLERTNLVKVFPQPGCVQAYGRLPVCIRLGPVSSLFLLKVTYRCRARELLSLKDFMHSVQVCGLSPVWTRICTVRADLWMNSFPHSSHLYGLYQSQQT